MARFKVTDETRLWVTGRFAAEGDGYRVKAAVIRDGLSTLTETTVEVLTEFHEVDFEAFLGQRLTLHLATNAGKDRVFTGTVVTIERLGFRRGLTHLVMELRPRFWLLTKTRNNRIFQEMTAVDIIRQVFSDNGFTGYKLSLSESYVTRTYCVQYRESDFDFVSRLMEEEGIYYYFDHKGSGGEDEKLVLCDSMSAHQPIEDGPRVHFQSRGKKGSTRDDHISEWERERNLTYGKVSLRDFDFTSPMADLTVSSKIAKGKHPYKDQEHYDYPGSYRKDTELGKMRARVRMESEAVQFERRSSFGNVRTMAVGAIVTVDGLDDFQRQDEDGEFLVTEAVHFMKEDQSFGDPTIKEALDPERIELPEDMEDLYSVRFTAVPKTERYRAPQTTPWPQIPGLHTAIVTGPSGEEIYTDKYGRIKVQFHWDREGKNDENTTCWVRVVTPWSGKNWGAIAVPRIGQEVVIQFEEGDPDRPICTGMLYNEATMPPYTLPENMTQSGVKTNSSKGGDGFNELMFEDKKDEELVRFQAERDYEQIVKNDATITIGLEKKDKGDLTQTVHRHVTETIKTGDHTYTVETGSQFGDIKTDKKFTIHRDKEQTVKGKNTRTITGNDTTKVSQGNQSTTVDMGNITTKASMGKITLEAMQSIELKVGSTSIKLTPMGVTIKGMMVTVQGDAQATLKAPMTNVKGDAMVIVKGGLTLIN